MASFKERKKEVDCETKYLNSIAMKRGKPHQQLYRPGSGPLRKSTPGIDESESDTKLVVSTQQNKARTSPMERIDKIKSADSSPRDTNSVVEMSLDKLGDMTSSDAKRRMKKPEQPLYVPRHMAQARDVSMTEDAQMRLANRNQPPRNIIPETNGSEGSSSNFERTLNQQNKSKRYSNRRRTDETFDCQQEWRTSNVPIPRNLRQGSEPRAISNQNNSYNGRCRDTRSVEPPILANKRSNYNNDSKMNSKPPSGRRHSTIGLDAEKRLKNLDNLPPRFKKKFLEDNNLTGNSARNEENWDGASITFQGTQNYTSKSNYSNYSTIPSNAHHHVQNQSQLHQGNMMYYTLPTNRPRGRGRMQPDFDNHVGMYRSATPEKMFASPSNSRSLTPSTFGGRVQSNENLTRYDGGYQTQHRNDNYSINDDRKSVDRKGDRYGDDRKGDKYEDRFHKNGNQRSHRNSSGRYEINRNNNQNGALQHVPEGSDHSEVTPKRGFRDSLEAQLSPVSPPTPPEKDSKNSVPVSSAILDWSEEVELNDRLEAEALSDALTRSSSVASLMEVSTKSLPNVAPNQNQKPKRKKNKKGNRRRSSSRNRDRSTELHNHNRLQSRNQNRDDRNRYYDANRTRQNSVTSTDSRDNFKVPESRRRNSRDARDRSYDKRNRSRDVSRESSFDRTRRSSCNEHENWRDEIRKRQNSEREVSREPTEQKEVRKGGIIILPPKGQDHMKVPERPRCPDITRKTISSAQKTLFDPNNPNKPIVVKSPNLRVAVPGFSDNTDNSPPQLYATDQFGNVIPSWYDEHSDKWKLCHYPDVLRDIISVATELQFNISSGLLLVNWGSVAGLRNFLMQSLEYLLCNDIKFCQSENVEKHFWNILFHNIIEMMRKAITNDAVNREQYKGFVLFLIDEGVKYFELLLSKLEEVYNFKISSFLNYNTPSQKGKFVGLALISAQKIFLYLGHLLRYREEVNETFNYGKCRQWFIKAQEINPKNGKPYNQLAVLAVYARRKLDAVYYFMRCLMSSNPNQSARESLSTIFDENRKKYEQGERKRLAERMERARKHMKEKESEAASQPNCLRRETWIRPDGGRRVHRTTSAVQEAQQMDSDEEDLAALSSVEVNKRFVTSYLHVHGKLISKIGMESFQEAAIQMLKEFRALLQHSPVPLPCKRLLQLLALNMYAIDNTQLKDPELQSQGGYRSELQERALVVSLQMFSLILERCVSLLQDHLKSKKALGAFPQDLQILLPAVKIWCDWMLCHSLVWNPPPSTQDYKVGAPGDAWSRIAALMNLLEKLDQSANESFVSEPRDGYEQVRLLEDAVLSGFTPLMHNVQEPTYVSKDFDMEQAQFTLRLSKLLFFGTVFLCGLEPPVLKLELENDYSEYISVVQMSSCRSSPPSPPELNEDDDLLVESFSEDESGTDSENKLDNAPSEIRDLLSRKVALEKRQRHQEIHRQRVQKILQQSVVSVHIEVRPKYLIPDTNCFIDYLEMIKTIASAHVYTLMVPLVVLNELEGLTKGCRHPAPATRMNFDPEHVIMVAESAKHALDFLGAKNANIKCITTKGTILASSTFTVEDDSVSDLVLKNDDKILSSCLALCKVNKDQHVDGVPRKLHREVVLLTEDRNLRVKALARDVPVRELPDFIIWAGLG